MFQNMLQQSYWLGSTEVPVDDGGCRHGWCGAQTARFRATDILTDGICTGTPSGSWGLKSAVRLLGLLVRSGPVRAEPTEQSSDSRSARRIGFGSGFMNQPGPDADTLGGPRLGHDRPMGTLLL